MSEGKLEITNPGVSKEPVLFPLKPVSGTPAPTAEAEAGLAQLAYLARQAFEEKRKKQCLSLTGAILKIDPQFKEALVIQSWLRSDLDRDLETAQRLIENAEVQQDPSLYVRAENLVQNVLDIDPGLEDAAELLRHIIANQPPPDSAIDPWHSGPADVSHNDRRHANRNRLWRQSAVAAGMVVALLAGFFFFIGSAGQNASSPMDARLELFVLPVTGVQMSVDDGPAGAVPAFIDVQPGHHRLQFTAPGYLAETLSAEVAAGERRSLTVLLERINTATTASRPSPIDRATPRTQPVANPAQPGETVVRPNAEAGSEPPASPVLTNAPGTLAISAAVPVEIYAGNRLVGTTPVSLELPPGDHPLEYRYGNLRKTISHAIRSNDVTRATITFDMTLRINARPWAQVFVDGAESRSLGQTPLSGVQLPVGSILVFRHPNFPEKRVRVGTEATIQVVFP